MTVPLDQGYLNDRAGPQVYAVEVPTVQRAAPPAHVPAGQVDVGLRVRAVSAVDAHGDQPSLTFPFQSHLAPQDTYGSEPGGKLSP